MSASIPATRRIMRNVEVDPESKCWNWIGKPRDNGYCRTTFNRMSEYVHRMAYMVFVGEIPGGMDVCHKCDNRTCCNPMHLFVGTRKDNMLDAVSKNRQAKGFALPQTKLSDEDKADVIKRAVSGEPHKSIAEDFNVTSQLIGKVAIKQGVRRRVSQ